MLGCAALACTVSALASGAGARPSQGGTFRIALPAAQFDSIDPYLNAFPAPGFVFGLTCASLLAYPPKAPPAGYRLVPDLAATQPRITNGGRTYTYTLRAGRRFSTGAPVTVGDVAASFHRALDPRLRSTRTATFEDIVGAGNVLAGRARRASGVVVRPRKRQVVFRLRRARADFLATSATLCVVPAGLPLDPEGVRPVSAGPYVVTSYVPGRRVVLTRNRNYSGHFRGRVDRFEVALTDAGSIVGQVERGDVDWGWVSNQEIAPRAQALAERHGVNRSRFFLRRGLFRRMLVLNASQPLFRNNARLRRAVNFAIDRRALLRARGFRAGVLTDQYLPPGLPGFRNERIYPLGRPDIRTARRLARGRTRGGEAVFYGPIGSVGTASGEIVRRSLAPLGISVAVRLFPNRQLFDRLATRGEPFDIGWIGWLGPPDPVVLNFTFHGKGCCNRSNFDSPRYNALLRRAARLTGRARYRAYGRIDVDLARNAAPAVQYAVDNAMTFVGPRVPRRCVVLNPELDLRSVCLR
ncbi:MAG: hypothetical protein ICV64_04200 [Thermoleophilia bacterium]|nr:hypothetical protein [Thermoleophilia bacterium]